MFNRRSWRTLSLPVRDLAPSTEKVITDLNAMLRGFANYFKMAN
ncbi:MAG: hypothetical protein H8E66_04060 [Planctomycetes bacterium]|nr:hypothetical protein [Planctomycetota bacterium]